ncbi:potassium-transporting ATPase subunit KdpC [Sporomusa sp.]|uniref:potassium-transporting ATPase subunit KdpC n=1 Tax=Sporomusa sp. TaxID=2078658 RepID=UPI002BA265DD|nr:potassium-transporting ATPase subunit KdpC [Sporomusa sp.]HWR42966.1 potassium-transporting ATPase subunit KdpC [Sporomusa sp.]
MINSLMMVIVLTVLTGIAYPLAMTALAQTLLPQQANGSLITKDGQVIGSRLIGQNFTSPGYFHGRPSAAGADGYDAASSSGSNLGPTNQKLKAAVAERITNTKSENNLPQDSSIPGDLVLASASGLDPHISPASAYLQVERVATERGLPFAQVRSLVDSHTASRQFGFLGEPRVNVLELNLALDVMKR